MVTGVVEADDQRLLAVLDEAKQRGLLGGSPQEHLRHSVGFADVVERRCGRTGDASTLVDLGSGGGVPGLVLAARFPARHVVLVDSALRRCRFLEWACGQLGLRERVQVEHGRAENLARGPLRETCGVLTARSFGPPGVTAECARGFLSPSGFAVISDPPSEDGDDRWPREPLVELGFRVPERIVVAGQHFTVLGALGPCPGGVPRGDGVPRKRPLF
jgi:16S rRNA (guanine527-N7)-methyltransferase